MLQSAMSEPARNLRPGSLPRSAGHFCNLEELKRASQSPVDRPTKLFYNKLLLIAALYGNAVIVEFLLSQGADSNFQDSFTGVTPLHQAAYCSSIPRFALALAPNTYDGHEKTVQVLLKAGARSLIKNKEGLTALDIAQRHQQTQITFLLQARSDHSKNVAAFLKKLISHVDWTIQPHNNYMSRLPQALIDKIINYACSQE